MPKRKNADVDIKPIATPMGRFSNIHFTEPNDHKTFGGFYDGQLLVSKEEWKKVGIPLAKMVIKCAQENMTIKVKGEKVKPTKLNQFQNPFKDGDVINEERLEEDKTKLGSFENSMVISAKNSKQPHFMDAGRDDMSASQIKAIKGGDYGRFVVTPYFYDHGTPGVGLWLELVQYWKPGQALSGPSKQDLINEIDDLEVEDFEASEEDEDDTEKSLEESFDEMLDDDEAEEDDEEEEDEEPAPPKKKAKSKAKSKSKTKSKAKAKKKVVEEDDDDEEIDLDDL